MQKLKDKLPSIFGNTKVKNVTNGTKIGKLETDAVGRLEDEDDNGNRRGSGLQHSTSATSTPTASADLTASVVRELSDPNYNSMEVMPISGSGGELMELNGSLAAGSSTNNTMNVHNAQQQVVMQFSNANNLHFGSVYNFNGATVGSNSQKNGFADEQTDTVPAPDAGKRPMPRKTTSVVVMMQSQEEPNHRILDSIATHLGEGWKEVMRELGQSNGQIEQAVIDHQMHGGIKEVIYQLLLQWLRNADDGVGTLGYITTLLWESNHRDCVQRMKLVWKSEAKRKTSR